MTVKVTEGWEPPVIYDIRIDSRRAVTQKDIDELLLMQQNYSRLIGKVREILVEHEAMVEAIKRGVYD